MSQSCARPKTSYCSWTFLGGLVLSRRPISNKISAIEMRSVFFTLQHVAQLLRHTSKKTVVLCTEQYVNCHLLRILRFVHIGHCITVWNQIGCEAWLQCGDARKSHPQTPGGTQVDLCMFPMWICRSTLNCVLQKALTGFLWAWALPYRSSWSQRYCKYILAKCLCRLLLWTWTRWCDVHIKYGCGCGLHLSPCDCHISSSPCFRHNTWTGQFKH